MLKTRIEWCDSTWNPVTGRQHDCLYCYARRMAERFSGYDPVYSATVTLLERYGGDQGAALTAYNAGYDTGERAYANAVLAAGNWRKP